MAVCVWLKDVANCGALGCEVVGRGSELLVIFGIGQGNEEISSAEGIDVVSDPLFLLRMIPNLMSFSSSVDFLGHLIYI